MPKSFRVGKEITDVIEFLKLTNGTMPLIILYNNGGVQKTFRYKNMDEYQIINFLQK